MPTKKKKPTLKAAVNRGFATTSVAKKVLPDAEPEDAAPSADAEASVEETKADEKAIAAPAPPKIAGRFGFDEEDAEQQLLQSLVEKHADKVDKDVARFWKVGMEGTAFPGVPSSQANSSRRSLNSTAGWQRHCPHSNWTRTSETKF